jgi:type IV secretory pathway TrbL component
MKASRGMGAVMPSKMPKGVKKARRDDTDFTQFAKGGKVGSGVTVTKGGTASAMAKKLLQKPGSLTAADMYAEGGLYENIHKKRARILAGSGEKMRSPGSKGAPTAQAFKNSAKTAKKRG